MVTWVMLMLVTWSGNQFTVRGFHGNYEVHVIYQGRELGNLKQTFTLGKGAHTANLNVHTQLKYSNAMKDLVVPWMLAMMVTWCTGQNLLQNAGQHHFDGPSQYITVKQGHTYTVVQTKKSFPFGTAVNSWKYNDNSVPDGYRDFIHKHFNWAVPESALKWMIIEPQRGHKDYQLALKMIHGVKSHGLKVRGHNLVWSVPSTVQDWVKAECHNTQQLRNEVKHHIEETMDKTRGLLEHWDVNNENLHGTWYQDCLHDPDYNLELFRIAHNADPYPKLFLNDYNVVASGASTGAYLAQALQFKAANVWLYGLGVQCHFGNEEEPDQDAIKSRLDTLAAAGLPIWVTELDVQAADEDRRADFYEKALKALYGHPAVEGILFWGFWDQAHWRGEKASLWMTDETHVLSQSGNQFTVRGFHGDYEVHVVYQGHELGNLKKTFTLGKGAHTVNLNVHT
nr:hypothetical protein BaRGS_026277 [Batillaria attramentaria]